jgi:hypothetical protein
MAQILVRDLAANVVARLKEHARQNHRTLQGEITAILEEGRLIDPLPPELKELWR